MKQFKATNGLVYQGEELKEALRRLSKHYQYNAYDELADLTQEHKGAILKARIEYARKVETGQYLSIDIVHALNFILCGEYPPLPSNKEKD